jgi:hypothetical protein
LFDKGDVIKSADWATFHSSYVKSIQRIVHPAGSKGLKLRKKYQKPDKQWLRNGVGFLRSEFLKNMVSEGWTDEGAVELAVTRDQPPAMLYPEMTEYREPITSKFGGFDFVTVGPEGGRIAIEWETGNISSSHRSLNKLAIALAAGILEVGVLVVPSRDLYEHLTDRIGNIGELSGYLSLWESLKVTVPRGLLAITVVEQDELTDDETFPYLRVGSDGRARKEG